MIDMSLWEEMTVDVVGQIHLDPNNVRIEQPEGVPEADIIHDLFATEKAFALVEGIVKVGYLTHEVPIVVRRGRKLIVVEGNRRVAALKAIQNPYLAPEFQARIAKLTNGLNLDSLKTISVKRAPSQDEADQLIAALHTGNQRVAWTPNRQAAFFQAQIDAGKTPEQLIRQYPTVDVKKFVVRSRILNLFRAVKYVDPALVDYVKQRRFPVSTLERLYNYDQFMELAGIEVDDANAMVKLVSRRAVFSQIAEKVIGDIKLNRINTRTLNSTASDSYRKYMDELKDLVDSISDIMDDDDDEGGLGFAENPPAGKTRGGGGRATDGGGGGSDGASKTDDDPSDAVPNDDSAPSPPAPSRSRQNRAFLDMQKTEVPDFYPVAIKSIHAELSSINIQRFPNASLDLLRTFLEKLIKAYASKLGEDIKKVSNTKGFVQLSHCLEWLENYFRNNGKTQYIQVIAKIKGKGFGSYIPTLDHMNAINHNHEIFATSDEVKDCWLGMAPIVKVMLQP